MLPLNLKKWHLQKGYLHTCASIQRLVPHLQCWFKAFQDHLHWVNPLKRLVAASVTSYKSSSITKEGIPRYCQALVFQFILGKGVSSPLSRAPALGAFLAIVS